MTLLRMLLLPCVVQTRALLVRRWDWRTCWREGEFWLCMATLLMPFGFVLLLFQWEPVRARLLARR